MAAAPQPAPPANLFPTASVEPKGFLALAIAAAVVLLMALGAFHYLEEHGHVATGMGNEVVWGLPHVFAIFLIVTASGALNVASVSSVFGVKAYKPGAALSALLALALLAGGLMILGLDLGRPERLVVAATHYNFKSIFAWNMILYNGFLAIVAVYAVMSLERRWQKVSAPVGVLAFVWRIILTTGTGSIFGFLIARPGYASAVIAPLFIALSLAWGTAVFSLAKEAVCGWYGVPVSEEMRTRLRRLLGIFVVAALYLTAVHHLTNLYWARQTEFERFFLLEGGVYTGLFWVGFVLVGSFVPLWLTFHPALDVRRSLAWASGAVVVGAFAFLYSFIIPGQAFPMDMLPGYEVTSGFRDGVVAPYRPTWPEFLLGMGGVALAFLIALVVIHLFKVVPRDEMPAPGEK